MPGPRPGPSGLALPNAALLPPKSCGSQVERENKPKRLIIKEAFKSFPWTEGKERELRRCLLWGLTRAAALAPCREGMEMEMEMEMGLLPPCCQQLWHEPWCELCFTLEFWKMGDFAAAENASVYWL